MGSCSSGFKRTNSNKDEPKTLVILKKENNQLSQDKLKGYKFITKVTNSPFHKIYLVQRIVDGENLLLHIIHSSVEGSEELKKLLGYVGFDHPNLVVIREAFFED
jgi:hypothetical protein